MALGYRWLNMNSFIFYRLCFRRRRLSYLNFLLSTRNIAIMRLTVSVTCDWFLLQACGPMFNVGNRSLETSRND